MKKKKKIKYRKVDYLICFNCFDRVSKIEEEKRYKNKEKCKNRVILRSIRGCDPRNFKTNSNILSIQIKFFLIIEIYACHVYISIFLFCSCISCILFLVFRMIYYLFFFSRMIDIQKKYLEFYQNKFTESFTIFLHLPYVKQVKETNM